MIQVRIEGRPGLVLQRMAGSIEGALREGILAGALHQEGVLRKQIYATFRGRTGALPRSFRTTLLTASQTEVSAGVLSSNPYAAIQDRGGTIVPRTRQNLAVPLRRTPIGKWPRDFAKGELIRITSKRGNVILAKVTGRKLQPMFVLKRQVVLKGRDYLEAAAEAGAPGVAEAVSDHIARGLDQAGG